MSETLRVWWMRAVVLLAWTWGWSTAPSRLPSPSRDAPMTESGVEAMAPTFALTGTVRDSTGRALPDADITIAALSLATRTDKRGAYRLTRIPAGALAVVARHLGYAEQTATLEFGAQSAITHDFVMQRLSTLDSVTVTATPLDNEMRDFEEHRRLGLGHVFSRSELAQKEGLRMTEVLSGVRGLGLVNGVGGRGWILGKGFSSLDSKCRPDPRTGRAPPGSPAYIPDKFEASQGMTCACYAQVYMDGALMNPGTPAEPFDVNSVPVAQLEAVEFYSSPAQMPSRYNKLNAACGVYVMHMRRSL